MHIHEEVLAAANRIAQSQDWTFRPDQLVSALPHLNVSSVRTHIVSRCCVNAPKNHMHKWDYFSRVGRGLYEVRAPYRNKQQQPRRPKSERVSANTSLRDTIHVIVSRSGDDYVAECSEVAVVSQGSSLDELLGNVQDAISLHLEGEDHAALGLTSAPRVQLIYDVAQAG